MWVVGSVVISIVLRYRVKFEPLKYVISVSLPIDGCTSLESLREKRRPSIHVCPVSRLRKMIVLIEI